MMGPRRGIIRRAGEWSSGSDARLWIWMRWFESTLPSHTAKMSPVFGLCFFGRRRVIGFMELYAAFGEVYRLSMGFNLE